MKNITLTTFAALLLALVACQSSGTSRTALEDASAPLPEIRYYEIADT